MLQSLSPVPVLTLLGPKQSGKTTLVKETFPDFEYLSLEDPDIRELATSDPRGFLSRSQNHLLIDSITQTLAGRTALFELLPLSIEEISQKHPLQNINDYLFRGGYPRIYNNQLEPTSWLKNYFSLYVEKDIRQISNITNIDLFEKFIRLAAGRAGQLVNAASLGNEVGVTGPTISSWISALKATYIAFTLQPHFKNFNKKIVKTPKLYFYDTGLLCYLLGIQSSEQLNTHPLRGNIFENFIVSEAIKKRHNQGKQPELYFWRDQKGNEIDLLEDRSSYLFPVEIKFSETFHPSFTKNIEHFNKLQDSQLEGISSRGAVIYNGELNHAYKEMSISNWKEYFCSTKN